MRKVIGIGETILDIIFKGNQPHVAVPGGSVFNGLVSLGRLGVDVFFISEIGNDKVGDIIQNFMVENHISTQYVDRYPDGKSPLSLAFLDENHNANYSFYKDYPNQRLNVPFPPIQEDDIFIFGSYYALNPVLRRQVAEFLDYARDRNAIIYYDPNFRASHAHEAIHVMPVVLENFEYADIVRGSDEDFYNLFKQTDLEQVYNDHVKFYCDNFLVTRGADGVNLYTDCFSEHFDTPSIKPVSTIGAGDSFNAGIVYGLLKYDIRKKDIPNLSKEEWKKIVTCGLDFSSVVCQSFDNYISSDFAHKYISEVK